MSEQGGFMMQKSVFTMDHIAAMVKPLADKYRVREIYLFGSYARGEAGMGRSYERTF